MNSLLLCLAIVVADAPPEAANPVTSESGKPSKEEPGKSPEPSNDSTAKPAEGNSNSEAPTPRRVIDRSYQPSIGDHVVLYDEDEKGESFAIWATTTPEDFLEYMKSLAMENSTRSDQLEKEGKAIILDDETPAVILAMDPVQVVLRTQQVVVENVGVAVGAQTASNVAVTVRILKGPQKGKLLYTLLRHIIRFRTSDDTQRGRRGSNKKAVAKRKPVAIAARPVDPALRAATLLKSGQNLEKAGKRNGAREFYRKVVAQYPKTTQAKVAAERVRVLEMP